MKHKYIDEAVGFYIIFGRHGNGNVDVHDGTRDIFVDIPKDLANSIVREQKKFLGKVYKILEDY